MAFMVASATTVRTRSTSGVESPRWPMAWTTWSAAIRSLPRSLATSKVASGSPTWSISATASGARAIDTSVMSSSCSQPGPVNDSRSSSTAWTTSSSGAVRPTSARIRGNPYSARSGLCASTTPSL